MYNRYIPQPDGTYRRTRVQDRTSQRPQQPPAPPPAAPAPPPCPPAPQESKTVIKPSNNRHTRPSDPHKGSDSSIKGFLQNILPKDFDTGDLLIVILLLLMSADSSEDQNSALLTLALYFFM